MVQARTEKVPSSCPSCGRASMMKPDPPYDYWCGACKLTFASTRTVVVPPPMVAVWSYPGRTQADAAEIFAGHAVEMAAQGYSPISQSWAEGRPGVARVLMIGLFASMIKPKGFLTVTYALRQDAALSTPPAADDTMACPRCAETIKKTAKICRFCQLDLTTA